MTIPLAPPGRTLETIRLAARRRFLLAAWFLALGTLLLAAAEAFLLLLSSVGGVTALILGALMQILGLSAGAYGAVVLSRAFPLSESGLSARFALLASLLVVLPVSAGLTAAYVLLALPEPPFAAPTSLVVLPHPGAGREPLAVGVPGDRDLDLRRLEAQLAPAGETVELAREASGARASAACR